MPQVPVVVVGAGVGGMAAALVLAARGHAVTVLEAQPVSGGKLRQVDVAGQGQDAGPTVFTMRWVFEELFACAGETLADCVPLRRADLLARHGWNDQSRLDLYADIRRNEDAIGVFAGPKQARLYRQFCIDSRRTYQTLEHAFVRATRPNPLSLAWRVGVRGLPGLVRMAPFRTLWDALGRYFPDPRLRQLFGRYATYCGSSPFQASATLMLVAHVEQSGVWCLDGGMVTLARALEAALQRKGVQLRFGCQVQRILTRQGHACGVALQGGETVAASAVVFNGDAAALAGSMLGAHPVPEPRPARRSLSAITWNLVSPACGFALARHNVFFSGDYQAEFDQLADGRLARHPTVYVCAHDRDDHTHPPGPGAERLMCLVNAPALGDSVPLDAHAIDQVTTQVFDRLRRCGLRLYPQADAMVVTTPTDFSRMFPGTGGALYGEASHGWRASFRRPGVRAAVPGLYRAGGSTHPGPGVPMAALSGRLAAACVIQDLERAAARRRP
jgi:1-hydroxycarotenoid 3,4-desaturase